MIDPTVQQARQNHLEALYFEDGRDNPEHPMHGLYTGLAAMERWRGNCRAEPVPANVLVCMVKRLYLHYAANNHKAANLESSALAVFTRAKW